MRYLFLGIFVIFWIYNLSLHRQKELEIGYYFWTTKCQIPDNFRYNIYLKVLDIGLKNTIKTTCKVEREFTPVIFIDNLAMKKHSLNYLEKVIKNTLSKYQKIDTVEFDCDWTNQTRDKYFKLLKRFKHYFLEATIRLHQVKYFKKTGVPPVDRGVLMFYNMSDFLNPDIKNYILDIAIAKKYMVNFDTYPLKLDIALPKYSQATIIRYGEVIGLIQGVRKKDLDDNFKELKDGRYKLLKTHYFLNKLLYKDDIIRVDEVSKKSLVIAYNLLKKHIKNKIKTVIYYRYVKY